MNKDFPLWYGNTVTTLPDTKPDSSLRHLTDDELFRESIAALTYLTICREEIARRNMIRKNKTGE